MSESSPPGRLQNALVMVKTSKAQHPTGGNLRLQATACRSEKGISHSVARWVAWTSSAEYVRVVLVVVQVALVCSLELHLLHRCCAAAKQPTKPKIHCESARGDVCWDPTLLLSSQVHAKTTTTSLHPNSCLQNCQDTRQSHAQPPSTRSWRTSSSYYPIPTGADTNAPTTQKHRDSDQELCQLCSGLAPSK